VPNGNSSVIGRRILWRTRWHQLGEHQGAIAITMNTSHQPPAVDSHRATLQKGINRQRTEMSGLAGNVETKVDGRAKSRPSPWRRPEMDSSDNAGHDSGSVMLTNTRSGLPPKVLAAPCSQLAVHRSMAKTHGPHINGKAMIGRRQRRLPVS